MAEPEPPATESMNPEPMDVDAVPHIPEGHPSDRWELAFVYAFIVKFTPLRKQISGLDSPMDLERALISSSPEPDSMISAILVHFVLNLRPQARGVDKNVNKHVFSVINDACVSPSERTVWWNEDEKKNINPLIGTNFFAVPWDTKLEVLRQLVEGQLVHCSLMRDWIDQAWGVKAAKHQKKADKAAVAPPPPEDPHSFESLRMIPIGQDSSRKRYWRVDDSPRVWSSGNPWKKQCQFTAVSSNREEFVQLIETLKQNGPSEAGKHSKSEQGHLELLNALEKEFLPKIDEEAARIAKARKRAETKALLALQAEEIRTTRTRRSTRRPEYVYDFEENEGDEDDGGGDDYKDTPDVAEDDYAYAEQIQANEGRRRSSRATVVNSRKRSAPDDDSAEPEWRGERRSSRLGKSLAPSTVAYVDDPDDIAHPRKRAKSTASSTPGDALSEVGADDELTPPKAEPSGSVAAATTIDTLPSTNGTGKKGKKGSKYWFYQVEYTGPNDETTAPADEDDAANGVEDGIEKEFVDLNVNGSISGGVTELVNTNPLPIENGKDVALEMVSRDVSTVGEGTSTIGSVAPSVSEDTAMVDIVGDAS